MSNRRAAKLMLGGAAVHLPAEGHDGGWVEREGERFYCVTNYHAMPPFLMSVLSSEDHWLFVSSTGGLTCGRREADLALFPYCTDDKVHDAWATTGPRTLLLVETRGSTAFWEPFQQGPSVYAIKRNLFKNATGNKLEFEEINTDLGLRFSYSWTTSRRFGFVRRARLTCQGPGPVRVTILDGLRNLLPFGVQRAMQDELSTLVDAYKQAELIGDAGAGLYTLGSMLTDRAEPDEALKATMVWGQGLQPEAILISEDQVGRFCAGNPVQTEPFSRGKRGAFFMSAKLDLAEGESREWCLLADVGLGPCQVTDLLQSIRQGVSSRQITDDVDRGTARLQHLAGLADGWQFSSDERVTARHLSSTLANIMRGGVFPHGYRFPPQDFLAFVSQRNRSVAGEARALLAQGNDSLTLQTALQAAEDLGKPALLRMVYEYLPLAFSRRHGDPSRPWNQFSIRTCGDEGQETLNYEGNWRDIFQNWEALALSFPDYIESFIAKFVNASTPDGHNPYRISREGIEWEVLEPNNPWSNIGYWGDHQVAYLMRLVELSIQYHPGRLEALLRRDLFVYADVPYRIKPYAEMVVDPRDSVDYDADHERVVARRVASLGSDGKLVSLNGEHPYEVNLLEKLLLTALARLGNLVPGGGIWMNTQRPEWNDANNALVGHGLSMVTLCYLRRYIQVLTRLLQSGLKKDLPVSEEVAGYLTAMQKILQDHTAVLDGPVDAAARKAFMDTMGTVNDVYRSGIYHGLSGRRVSLSTKKLLAFLEQALAFLDHSIGLGRREDGLFHSYNLIHFQGQGYEVEPLEEMLEGQVAVLSSGYLDAGESLDLLRRLKTSRLYREDQDSYMLYPDRQPRSFLENNVIPASLVASQPWIRQQVHHGCRQYVQQDAEGRVHFAPEFRNGNMLRRALQEDPAVAAADADSLCAVYEKVFHHRRFTGRSGSMFKYEGLGCIYWHMVSKLALATAETCHRAKGEGVAPQLVEALSRCYREIQSGMGTHKTPMAYGAFPIDPYSHTPGFAGAQQPGLTGQVKEAVITRFRELGVRVEQGELVFEPRLLSREEFLSGPATWIAAPGDGERALALTGGELGFTICGVPVVYRLASAPRMEIHVQEGQTQTMDGTRLGREWSRSLFLRDGRMRQLVVEIDGSRLL